MSFGRPTIRRKLWGILLLFLLVLAVSSFITYTGSLRIHSNLESLDLNGIRHAEALLYHTKEIENLFISAVAQREDEMLLVAYMEKADFYSNLKSLMAVDAEHLNLYLDIQKDFDAYLVAGMNAADQTIKKKKRKKRKKYNPELLEKSRKVVEEVLPRLKKNINYAKAMKYDTFEKTIKASTKEASRIHGRSTALFLVLVMISFFLFYRVVKSITVPLDKLHMVTTELATGNLDARADINIRDEIGDLSRSFNEMAQALQEQRNSLEESHAELGDLLEDRKKMEKEIIKRNEELKDANLRLSRADKAKSSFLASMSHELRTPLNAMINFTEQVIEDWDEMKSSPQLYAQSRKMLEGVLRSSRHLFELINDLLDLARIESGKMTLDLEESDLTMIVEESMFSVHSLAEKKGLELTGNFKRDEEKPILCDKRKVMQVFINLLGNAINFTDAGNVEVSIEKDAAGYAVRVADTGIGIDPEHLGVIFDRFRQVDSSDSRRHSGTGLGLNLVKELVEMHGGKVEVESEPGKGSTFTVYLPSRNGVRP